MNRNNNIVFIENAIKLRKKFLSELIQYLKLERGYARNYINRLFDIYSFPDHVYKRMAYWLDCINLGKIEWEDFIAKINFHIEYLNDKLKDENGEKYIQNIIAQEEQRKKDLENETFDEEYNGSTPLYYEEQECDYDYLDDYEYNEL